MITLAIDTSTLVMGVAVLENDKLLGEITTNQSKKHSVRLMPTVSGLMKELDLTASDLDLIAVASGPGSYTGVRIGFTTAKTLAWSRGIPLVGVSSLAVLAMNGLRFDGGVVPLFDARRNRVYTGLFRGDGPVVKEVLPERVIAIDDWLKDLRTKEGSFLFLGDDGFRFADRIRSALGERALFGIPGENTARAAHLGQLAIEHWKEQGDGLGRQAVPNYLQLAEAEAKWLQGRTNGVKKDGPSSC